MLLESLELWVTFYIVREVESEKQGKYYYSKILCVNLQQFMNTHTHTHLALLIL